jgi:uncharacterized membrane protein
VARRSRNAVSPSRHPVNVKLIDDAPLGARIADHVTGYLGSWRFIIIQTMIVAIWLIGNLYLLSKPFDPYPFILLNLAFSTQAAYAAPLILLAGNRASLRDRMTLEHAAAEADIEDDQNRELLKGNSAILKQVEFLEKRILEIETSILAAIEKHDGSPSGWIEKHSSPPTGPIEPPTGG